MDGGTWHRMKRNHGSEGPENVVTVYCPLATANGVDSFDGPCDSYVFRGGYAVGARRKNGKWYGEDTLKFNDTDIFWAWLQKWARRKSPVWIYSFGWSEQSQLLGLWNEIDKGKIKLEIRNEDRAKEKLSESSKGKPWSGLVCIDNRPFILIGLGPTGTYKFCDLSNYFPSSLQELCESDGDNAIRMMGDKVGAMTIERFGREVCERIHSVTTGMMTLWASESMGTWQPTIGRLADSNYRHRFMDDRTVIHKPKLPKILDGCHAAQLRYAETQDVWKAKRLERQGYIGGEVRHWFNGSDEGTVYHVDVTGHYAAIMRDCKLPYKLMAYREGDDCYEIGEKYGWENAIAAVAVDTKEDCYPIRVNEAIRWPIGQFATVLCGSELRQAVENGHIKAVYRIAAYLTDYICRDYANYWIQEKSNAKAMGNYIRKTLAKAMLVALPGKLGARGNKWKLRPGQACPCQWGNWVQWDRSEERFCQHRAIGGTAQCAGKPDERFDSFVCLPAFVCSHGRKKIRDYRLTLPLRSVYLQSTDSFLLTGDGYERAKDWEGFGSGQAGSWRETGRYENVWVGNANYWEAGTGPEGNETTRRISGIAPVNRQINTSEWRVRLQCHSGQAVNFGPSRIVARSEYVKRVRECTGDYGHYTDGWSDGPMTLSDMAQRNVEYINDYAGLIEQEKIMQQLVLFGYMGLDNT